MPPVAAPPKKTKGSAKRKSITNFKDQAHDELEEWKRSRQLLKPKGQLEIPEAELKESIARVLTCFNPQQPDSLVIFDYGINEFVRIPPPGNFLVVYHAKGTYLHWDSDDGRWQIQEMGLEISQFEAISDTSIEQKEEDVEPEKVPEETEESSVKEEETGEDEEKTEEREEEKEEEEKEEKEEKAEAGPAEGEPAAPTGKPKKLTNQFNFCERAAQTYNNPTRSQETQSIPPPMAVFSANVLQWVIYDAYDYDYTQQQLEKEREREAKEREKAPVSKVPVGKVKKGKEPISDAVKGRILASWKVLERMVNLNTYNDIAKDYRYWDDPSDEFRDDEGTLLPLWKFVYDKTKKHTVTDIFWSPSYYDLFTVCFGFLDFTKPIREGAVCLFTLKNPSFPEYICMTESCAMTAHIHPDYPYMMVVGLYNGNIIVYNMKSSSKEPAFRSKNVPNKHRGIVWEVQWVKDLPDGEMNFFSVGSDGKVNNWVLMQNELNVTTVINLYLARDPVPGPDGTFVKTKGCASCVTFHPKKPNIYLVGTEEGLIYKCSTEYSSSYLMTYHAHQMPVYRISFNNYNDDIFASCSADWRVKIWEDNRLEPLFVFDVGGCIGDVRWAPYSSTVFAVVCTDGKVYVFDLNVNKYKPICVQAVVPKKRNKLTRLSFNPKLPIMIVGDDKGCVSTLKLSPNLRIMCKAPKKQQYLDQWTLQCMKLDKLLALVREPTVLQLPPDTSGQSVDS